MTKCLMANIWSIKTELFVTFQCYINEIRKHLFYSYFFPCKGCHFLRLKELGGTLIPITWLKYILTSQRQFCLWRRIAKNLLCFAKTNFMNVISSSIISVVVVVIVITATATATSAAVVVVIIAIVVIIIVTCKAHRQYFRSVLMWLVMLRLSTNTNFRRAIGNERV